MHGSHAVPPGDVPTVLIVDTGEPGHRGQRFRNLLVRARRTHGLITTDPESGMSCNAQSADADLA